MKRQYKATLTCKLLSSHPDIDYVVGDINDPITFEDVYYINTEDFENDTKAIYHYIKRDLMLVAGGGYNSEHIYDVSFNMQ